MKNISLVIVILFFLFSTSSLLPQDSPAGYQNQIKSAILNSNNITTILYNYGSIGKPNTLPNVADFVWTA